MALTLPGLALWHDFCFLEKPWSAARKRRLAALAVFTAITAYYWQFRAPRSGYQSISQSSIQLSQSPGISEPGKIPARPSPTSNPSKPQWEAIYHSTALNARTMIVVFAQYFRLLIVPYPLRADRNVALISSWKDPRLIAACFLLVFLSAAGFWAYFSKRRALAWGLGWCFVSLIPVSNAIHIYNPMAERYLYVVCIGACWAMSALIESFPSFAARAAVSCAILIPFAALTFERNPDWKNDKILFSREAAAGSANARVYYNLGDIAQKSNQLTQARMEYEKAIALNPGYVEAINNLAYIEEARGHFKKALALYKKAVDLGPGSSIPYDGLGNILKKTDIPAAMTVYRHALEKNPGDVPARIALSGLLEKSGQLGLAINQLEDAARRDPGNANILMNVGVLRHHAGDLGGAVKWLQESIVADPDQAAAYYNLGIVQSDENSLERSKRSLKKALDLDPDYLDAAYALAVVEQKQGRIKDAIAQYRKVLAISPQKLEALNNLGGLYEMGGDLTRAERYLSAALILDPTRPSLLNNLGDVYLGQNRIPEAVIAYRKAIASSRSYRDPAKDMAPTLTNLGICYYRQGHRKKAVAAWRSAIKADPKYALAQKWMDLTRQNQEP
ncbi:MAG: tetratricopeptide repeat protein [Elusimicrobiota bacterium]